MISHHRLQAVRWRLVAVYVALVALWALLTIHLLAQAPPILRPDPTLTPGAVRPLTKIQVCSIKWGRDSRHVPLSMKKRVAKAYGVPWAEHSAYIFDHLIPRELAGEDVDSNIWPEPITESRSKDIIENSLHRAVCREEITLQDAQDQMQRWGR